MVGNRKDRFPHDAAHLSPDMKKDLSANNSSESQPHRYQPGSVPLREIKPARMEGSGSDSDGEPTVLLYETQGVKMCHLFS